MIFLFSKLVWETISNFSLLTEVKQALGWESLDEPTRGKQSSDLNLK